MKIQILLFLVCFPIIVKAQQLHQSKKGEFFVYWGWNRGYYSNSDIHFSGQNYEFTLFNVSANDRITPFNFYDYFHPARITIPQTNVRIGYFFHNKYNISIGVDHMKYVMNPYQYVKINGEINAGTSFDGIYNDETILLTHDFLQFEHTDGLNYVNIELKRFDEIGHLIGLSTENFQLNITEGVGGGIVYPKTNAKLFNQQRRDEFNIAGWGVSAGIGINITIFKHFFIQSDAKYGYINMPTIRTTNQSVDKASQSFTFFEKTILLGTRFRLF